MQKPITPIRPVHQSWPTSQLRTASTSSNARPRRARRSRPTDRRQVLEVLPEDQFLTYGLGVSLMQMRSPSAARARVPVGTPETRMRKRLKRS